MGRRDEAALLEALGGEPLPRLAYDEAVRQWKRAIGARRAGLRARAPKGALGAIQRYLVIPDLHVPFHEPDMVATMIAREAGRTDTAICIGDVGDSYSLSRFLQYERVSFREEWAQVTAMLDLLARSFPRVVIIVGNHDSRLEKQLRARLTPDMVEAVEAMTGGILCPLTALAKQYPNVEIARHVTPEGRTLDWFTTVGDAWLGHPEKWSRIPGSALRGVEEWLRENRDALGLDQYKLIVMGHTHSYTQFAWGPDQMLIECGALCKTPGYAAGPRIGGRPQRRGYVTFTQDDGKTRLSSVRFHWLEQS